jgi:hypothetical protein
MLSSGDSLSVLEYNSFGKRLSRCCLADREEMGEDGDGVKGDALIARTSVTVSVSPPHPVSLSPFPVPLHCPRFFDSGTTVLAK